MQWPNTYNCIQSKQVACVHVCRLCVCPCVVTVLLCCESVAEKDGCFKYLSLINFTIMLNQLKNLLNEIIVLDIFNKFKVHEFNYETLNYVLSLVELWALWPSKWRGIKSTINLPTKVVGCRWMSNVGADMLFLIKAFNSAVSNQCFKCHLSCV